MNVKQWRREFWISLLLLVAGTVLLETVTTADVTIDRKRLSRFPTTVMGMEGREQTLSEPVLQNLGLTDYLSRNYRSPSGGTWVDLYVGFYASQRTGATYHSPLNCMPGSGWQVTEKKTVPLPGPDGAEVRVNEVIIQKGERRQVVVYWYHDRGRVVASEYWAKIYMVIDAATRHRTDGAMVRVIAPAYDLDLARKTAREFARAIMPKLGAYLPS